MRFLNTGRQFKIAIEKPIATNANEADSIMGDSIPDLSNIPIMLIGIPYLIREREIVRDKSFLNRSSK
tara:strand:- start:251 stop:454 length:204 start_codon:yes stop_codon:yes gene_type:complete